MNNFTRAIAGTLAVIVIILGILSALCNTVLAGTPISQALLDIGGNAKYAALNAAVDASGVKGIVENSLRDNVDAIAATTGMSEQQVDQAIDELAISSWSVTELPEDATATGSVHTTYQQTDATVTTYDDPSYVTIDALGQSMTLSVPDSAQSYLSFLSYL